MEGNDGILVMCRGGGQQQAEVFQKTAGRKIPGENIFVGTLWGLGLRASELCGFSCLFTLEVHLQGKVFWNASLETASKFSRYLAWTYPGIIMDMFLPSV